MKILIASDLSPRSDRALARGFALAPALGASVEILYIVDNELPQELKTHSIEWTRKALSREIENFPESQTVEYSCKVAAGRAAADIITESKAAKADLIVLGIHNQAKKSIQTFAETTAGRCLRGSPLPVLLVKGECAEPYRKVVIGVDFSVFSRAAIRQAFRLAPAARFDLVHAYHVPYKAFLHSISEEIAYEDRLQMDNFLKEEMELAGGHALQQGIAPDAFEKTLLEGMPHEVIRDECARIDADLAVIGTHSKTGFLWSALGNTAAQLLENPPCDVLVVKPY